MIETSKGLIDCIEEFDQCVEAVMGHDLAVWRYGNMPLGGVKSNYVTILEPNSPDIFLNLGKHQDGTTSRYLSVWERGLSSTEGLPEGTGIVFVKRNTKGGVRDVFVVPATGPLARHSDWPCPDDKLPFLLEDVKGVVARVNSALATLPETRRLALE